MSKILEQRMSVKITGDFVVFLIGMRLNKIWKVWKWFPVLIAMPRMLRELQKTPELGLHHARVHFGLRNILVVQYWKSYEHLHAFSNDKTRTHLPAWQAFTKNIGSNGDVGIWHETYLIKAGEYEAVYNNMPIYGAAHAGELLPAKGLRSRASGRLEQARNDNAVVRPDDP